MAGLREKRGGSFGFVKLSPPDVAAACSSSLHWPALTQRTQYPIIKEYKSNQHMKAPII